MYPVWSFLWVLISKFTTLGSTPNVRKMFLCYDLCMNDIQNEQPVELDWLDSEMVARLEPEAREWLAEASQYFPDPPYVETIHWFGSKSRLILRSSGVGGYSYAPGEISLAWDSEYGGKLEDQMLNLKDTVFHEYYHQVQGYVGMGGSLGDLGPLQIAVYEGAATVFARDKTGVNDTFADYSEFDEDTITTVVKELSIIRAEDDWELDQWRFNHPKYGRHVLYKLGVLFVDRYLQGHSELRIEDLAYLSPSQVIKLSENQNLPR